MRIPLPKFIKTNIQLKKELRIQTEKAENFKNVCHTLLKKSTPERVIEKLLDRPIKWFDYTKLEKDEQIGYYNEAQAILRSPAFKNEKEAYILDLKNEIAMKSPNHEHTKALRYSINGVQALWERFGKINNPDNNPKDTKDPYAPI